MKGAGEAASGRASRAALTRREQEVAALVAGGATNRRIAEALALSEGTVADHVRRAMLKLELRGRIELALRVAARGDAGA